MHIQEKIGSFSRPDNKTKGTDPPSHSRIQYQITPFVVLKLTDTLGKLQDTQPILQCKLELITVAYKQHASRARHWQYALSCNGNQGIKKVVFQPLKVCTFLYQFLCYFIALKSCFVMYPAVVCYKEFTYPKMAF